MSPRAVQGFSTQTTDRTAGDCIEYLGDRTYRVGKFVTQLTLRLHQVLQVFVEKNRLESRAAMDLLRASCGELPPSAKLSAVLSEIKKKYPAFARCIQFHGKAYCGWHHVAIRRARPAGSQSTSPSFGNGEHRRPDESTDVAKESE